MVKVIAYYNSVSFGIEITKAEALQILSAYLNQNSDVIEIEGYGIYPKELIKLEFFDVV